MINEQLLALRLIYLAKLHQKNRSVWSERSLKKLAEVSKEDNESLTVPYLNRLKALLETQGYFWGSLKQGGYGLLAIDSIKGAESFNIDFVSIKSLDEKELKKEIRQLVSSQQSNRDSSLNNNDICELLWDLLTDLAKDNKTINYKKIPIETGVNGHHNIFTWPIKLINIFCVQNKLPTLSTLIIKKHVMLLELDNSIQKEIKQVFNYNDWVNRSSDFSAFLKTAINEQGVFNTKYIKQLLDSPTVVEENIEKADQVQKDKTTSITATQTNNTGSDTEDSTNTTDSTSDGMQDENLPIIGISKIFN